MTTEMVLMTIAWLCALTGWLLAMSACWKYRRQIESLRDYILLLETGNRRLRAQLTQVKTLQDEPQGTRD